MTSPRRTGRATDGRMRRPLGFLIVSLALAGGCSRTRSWALRDDPGLGVPRRDAGAREEVGFISGLHRQVFGGKNGLIDPNQVP